MSPRNRSAAHSEIDQDTLKTARIPARELARKWRVVQKFVGYPPDPIQLHSFVPKVLDAALTLTGGFAGNVQLVNPGTKDLHLVQQRGFRPDFLSFFKKVSLPVTACGLAWSLKKPIQVQDVTQSPIFGEGAVLDVILTAGVRSVQSIPVVGKRGKVLAVISVHYAEPNGFRAEHEWFWNVLLRRSVFVLENCDESEIRGYISSFSIPSRNGKTQPPRRPTNAR